MHIRFTGSGWIDADPISEDINPSSAKHDYSRFLFVLLADQITVIWNIYNVCLNKDISCFHLLEVVGRGSETQLQVGENLNYIIYNVCLNKNINCLHPLEVVGRDSETQLQVGENLNYFFRAMRVTLNQLCVNVWCLFDKVLYIII